MAYLRQVLLYRAIAKLTDNSDLFPEESFERRSPAAIEQEADSFYDDFRGSSANPSTHPKIVNTRQSVLVLAKGKLPGADKVLDWLVHGFHFEFCRTCQ